MPYIKQDARKKYNKVIKAVLKAFEEEEHPTAGDLNYVISSVIWGIFKKKRSYMLGNSLVGVLECVKQEFYRRQLASYEDEKIIEKWRYLIFKGVWC